MNEISLLTFAEFCDARYKTPQSATEYHHPVHGIPIMAAWYFGDVLASLHELPLSEKFAADIAWLHEQEIKFNVTNKFRTIFLYNEGDVALFKLARL
jgi:hypothetical protein